MPKYLIHGSYTPEGLRGLLKDGGSKRRAVVEQMLEKAGGKLEAFYYAFGDNDIYAIAEVPDNVSAASIALFVSAAGAFGTKTAVLLTPEEVDQATAKTVDYSPPGT